MVLACLTLNSPLGVPKKVPILGVNYQWRTNVPLIDQWSVVYWTLLQLCMAMMTPSASVFLSTKWCLWQFACNEWITRARALSYILLDAHVRTLTHARVRTHTHTHTHTHGITVQFMRQCIRFRKRRFARRHFSRLQRKCTFDFRGPLWPNPTS